MPRGRKASEAKTITKPEEKEVKAPEVKDDKLYVIYKGDEPPVGLIKGKQEAIKYCKAHRTELVSMTPVSYL